MGSDEIVAIPRQRGTCWGAAGVECPKEQGKMSVDVSCRRCEHWQVCYDKMMEALS